ncbi:thioester reductase domain-containing protein [Streptomyces sp. NPDC101191]|uniref:thioester reductase domain-containing protein n=1 Tax=Streptomyces sp. NPDC101191 TaxID=3366126 RepID=UPI00382D62AC
MTSETDIAIVGVGARFPDARGPAEFWHNLAEGHVSLREFTDDELREAAVDPSVHDAPDYVRVGVRLPGLTDFDAGFFGISPAEAELIDPHQRIFLEVCWEALEHAGHPPRDDGPLVGVYAGASFSTYAMALYLAKVREHGFVAVADGDIRRGSLFDFMPARVAHRLGLRGPAVAVQTACSSSLTAVHQAVNALLAGDCDIALAGGSGGAVPEAGYRHEPGGIASEDGYCRSFDAKSSGTATGAGVGVVVLRRLQDALADGDHIWAVVEGSAVDNDGADRPGFTAPSPRGVADVVRAALDAAGTDPDRLAYVEAHGSGTPLGDHVELLGLAEALRSPSGRTGFAGLGSVKTNVGHCGAAAGIAGLVKAVHVAHTGQLPPHPQFTGPRDPGVLAGSSLRIDTEPRTSEDPERRVLVHSMGQGGTNAAVVLRAPAPARPGTARPDTAPGLVRLTVSARSRTALDTLCRQLADTLDEGAHEVTDIAHTLRVGRRHFAHRRVVAAAPGQLAAALRLPRPPRARTVLARPLTALVVTTAPTPRAAAVTEELLTALGPGTRTAPEVPDTVPADTYLVVVGPGTAGPGRHVTGDGEDGAEAVDAALTAAWVEGVDVDWAAVAAPGARRVPLPTYAFERRRLWALDRLGDVLRGRPGDTSAPRTDRGPGVAADPRPGRLGAPVPASDALEAELVALWEELFGIAPVGVADEFDTLGGTSLLATRMALEIGRRHDVRLNLHRVGGTRATVRRVAEAVRSQLSGQGTGGEDLDGDGALIDADLELPLGDALPQRPGDAVLLTGATGFIGAFLLRELCATDEGPVYCLVRARDEADAWRRLRATAAAYALPEPDPDRVRVVVGDLTGGAAVLDRVPDAAARVGRVVHCAARVVFTEPYRSLREANVLATAELLRWMRANGVPDLTYVSSLAAATPTGAPRRTVKEERGQPLSAESGGYGASKWVCERLVERAERDGMRVRVFRPGLVLGDSETGACNPKDMTWRMLAGSLATGLRPADDRPLFLAPVDAVARAVVSLARRPDSLGRAYHLVDAEPMTLRTLIGGLAAEGLTTTEAPVREWHAAVAGLALDSADETLAAVALIRTEETADHGTSHGTQGEDAHVTVEAAGWRDWLAAEGRTAAVTPQALARSLRHLADRPEYRPTIGARLTELKGEGR